MDDTITKAFAEEKADRVPTPIETAYQELDSSVGELHELVAVLSKKLNPILRSPIEELHDKSEKIVEDAKVLGSSNSPMGQQLIQTRKRVMKIVEVVHYLNRSIEV